MAITDVLRVIKAVAARHIMNVICISVCETFASSLRVYLLCVFDASYPVKEARRRDESV